MKNSIEQKLRELLLDNPGLPIRAMVGNDVACDDTCRWWLGSIVDAAIEEYCVTSEGTTVTRGGDIWLTFEEFFDYGDCGITPDTPSDEAESIARERLESLPWKKAIFMYIDLPDVEV